MSQSPKAGVLCDLYYNSGSFSTPTWSPVNVARDVTINDEMGEIDASIRGDGGLAATLAGLQKIGLDFEILWYPTQAEFAALHTAYEGRTATEFLALDGPTTSASGAQGPRFTGIMTKFQPKQPLEGAVTADITVKRTISANATSWYTQS